MSISSMANAAYARRGDVEPLGAAPSTAAELAEAIAPKSEAATPVTSAMTTIATYIPTEVLTVYVAVIAALASSGSSVSPRWIAFLTFAIATPAVVWMTYAAHVKQGKGHLPTPLWEWPRWEMLFGTIAFVAWAFALPATPFATFGWYTPAIAGVMVLVITTLLGLLAPLIAQPITAPQATGAKPADPAPGPPPDRPG
jgi:hypothetical protein